MHIILGLLGLIAAAGFWIHRINAAARSAQDIADIAGEAANLPRKMRFQHRARKKALEIVDDPREAACVLMLGVARGKGEMTTEQKVAIREQMEEHFRASTEDAEELLARASWVSSDVKDPQTLIRKMVDFLIKQVTQDELRQLDDMLLSIARIEGDPTPEQAEFISAFRMRSGLR